MAGTWRHTARCIVGNKPGRTDNPEFLAWEAKRAKVEQMIDKVKRGHMAYDAKWVERTTAYYKRLLVKLELEKPARYIEDLTPGEQSAPGGKAPKRR